MNTLELPDAEVEGDGTFEALVAVNHRWLGRYARLHPSFSVEPALLERNSLWMNAFFQKSRMTTPAASPQAKNLIKKHRETVVERLRSAPLPHSESPFSTTIVYPMAALIFAGSADRCPHNNLEDLLAEAWELLQCASIRVHALQSGFAGCIFRFLIEFTETQKRIPCLRLLVLLAQENSSAVVNACKLASQGHFWQPNMFVFSLQKRHKDNSTLCELAAKLLERFSEEMPIPPPIALDQSFEAGLAGKTSLLRIAMSPLRGTDSGLALPLLFTGGQSPHRPLFSPTTTISRLYQEAPSPYSSTMKLPLTRPPTFPAEQSRRSKIFSMPKLAAIEGQRQHRCNMPNAPPSRIEQSIDIEVNRTLDPLFGSPPQSPSVSSPSNPRVVVSEKYSWNPECINSVSGFEWWWRSLPQNHASLEPTQKLKMVTKAAVRLHSKGELQRAIALYLLALSSGENDEVSFRLRINLACAYEAAENLPSSIDEFRLALELNPNDLYGIYKLGCVLTLVGEFDEARMHFESILDEYPQAADALRNLEKAVEAHQQQEEATKAAIAAAKERRSPSKIVSPRYLTPREPVASLTPVVQVPAPHRKNPPATKRVRAASSGEPSEREEATVVVEVVLPHKAETATVSTLTDDHVSSPSLLELLVRRCQEAHINMLEVLQQLDPQKLGLVHWESFIKLLQIIPGVSELNDDARMALSISPADWVSNENQVFLKYKGFIHAYTEQYQVEAALLSLDEVVQVKLLIDDFIRHDIAHFSHHSVSEWVRLGSERAAAELHRTSSSYAELSSREDEAPDSRHQSTLGGTCSAPNLLDHQQDTITPRTRVRKDRAREEWLFTAEKVRVLARRQQHCMKSLRDIATWARAHIVSRRKAMAFLLMVAQNAQEELLARKMRCLKARHESEDAEAHTDQADECDNVPLAVSEPSDTSDEVHLSAVKELSEETYDASVRTAMARLHQNAGLEDVKTVAARFAEFCQVPSYFLKV